MNIPTRQSGASMLSWMIIVLMAGTIGLAALKLAPVYMQYYSIVKIMEDLAVDPSLKGAKKQKIAQVFFKRLSINGVDDMMGKENYSLKKTSGKQSYTLAIKYEVRRSLAGNVSLVANFERSIEVGGG